MTICRRPVERALLGVLTVMGVACAHAPASSAAKDAHAQRIFVTGSHIPQRIDPATNLPQTISPVRVFSREQIDGTGRQYDLRASLGALDPSISR
jgi:hypothetical protein